MAAPAFAAARLGAHRGRALLEPPWEGGPRGTWDDYQAARARALDLVHAQTKPQKRAHPGSVTESPPESDPKEVLP